MMNLPKDPVMLLSVVNTYLRDYHASLEELCDDAAISADELVQELPLRRRTESVLLNHRRRRFLIWRAIILLFQ